MAKDGRSDGQQSSWLNHAPTQPPLQPNSIIVTADRMSKSLKRVRAALEAHGLADTIEGMADGTRTAQDAAQAIGCEIDQIAKSIIFGAETTGDAVLFITAGGNQVDAAKATSLVGGPLQKADAKLIRSQTGFAIGGVAPIGHLTPCRVWFDPHLLQFETVFPAAGTPRHVFSISPQRLLEASGATLAEFT